MSTTIERMLQESALRGKDLPTPLYIVNKPILEENIDQLYTAFFRRFPRFIFGYSYKTNYASAVLRIVHHKGGYAEVVSPMELAHAKQFVADNRIIYNGVIQDVEDKAMLAVNGGIVNVENLTELRRINDYLREVDMAANIGIRVNLPMSGMDTSRFGIELSPENISIIKGLSNIVVSSVHCHVAFSRSLDTWREKADKMAQAAKALGAHIIDLGGRMYGPMNPKLAAQFDCEIPTFQDYADCLYDVLSRHYGYEDMPTLIVEPGTTLISNAQSLLTTVADIKTVQGKTVCTLDAKKLDITVIGESTKTFPYYVINHGGGRVTDASMCGCTCLESDRLVEGYTGPLDIGDRVLFDNIGAYSNVVSPNFIQGTPGMALYNPDAFVKFSIVKLQDSFATVFGEYL